MKRNGTIGFIRYMGIFTRASALASRVGTKAY